MNTAQNYAGGDSYATPTSQTVDSDQQTAQIPAQPQPAPDERPISNGDERHRQQVATATRQMAVTVNSFFDLKYDELTPVRVMGNLLKHWITTTYKDQIRQIADEDWETSYLDNHVSAMIETIGFLSQLEQDNNRLELMGRNAHTTQTRRA